MNTLKVREDQHGRTIVYNVENHDFLGFRLLINHDYATHSIQYSVTPCGQAGWGGSSCVRVPTVSSGNHPPETNGKLTGVQLRTIAAVDQLQALLDDELYETIRNMAVLDDCGLITMLHQAVDSNAEAAAHENDPDPDNVVRAVKAMALFCYAEIVDRGLDRPAQ